MRKNQPACMGEALTSSGSLARSSLTATTSPVNGMLILLAALTDSSTATSLPSPYWPSSGNCTNTTSPNASWANVVMPTVNSPLSSRRSHSCSGVKRRVLMDLPLVIRWVPVQD
ncbi:hypothetical protein D3C86_1934440 [compost metagenome]